MGLKATCLGLSATLLSSLAVADDHQLPTTLQYADVFNIEYAASPFFSEDASTLYYVRRSMDIMQDRTTSALWQIDIDSAEHRPFLADAGNIREPVLSPDGMKLAFVSDQSGSAQLYVHYLDSGLQARLTNLQHSPANVVWSPDSTELAFTAFTPSQPARLFTDMPGKPDGAKWAESAKYIEKTNYRADGAGYLQNGHNQIYLLPLAGGTPRQLTTGEYPNSGTLSFSSDGKAVYFAADRQADFALHPLRADLFKVDTASRQVEQVTSMEGPEGNPKLSPNGKYLAFTQLNDRKKSYQNSDLVIMNLDSGKHTRLTSELDRSLGDFVWAKDSKSLVFAYDDKGHTRLARASLQGDIRKLDVSLGGQSLGRPYTSGQFALASDGTLAITTANPQRPADIALVSAKGKQRVVTQLNEDALGHLQLARVEHLPIKASGDDTPIDAWVAYPPEFDASKQYPMILEIHGGPHAAYGPHFAMEVQLMAAQGYVVVWSNPRGSSSYGEAFGNMIHHNYPSDDYQDLMDVVDAVVAKGNVDKDKLFITGGSGGGVLTAWSIGKTDRFAAAVVAKPVINWMSFALTADAYPYFSQYWMPGKPWEVADHLWEHSPLSLVGNVTTPTLLLTGEADYRTPISESEQFYQALRLQGVDAAMVRIPGASHGIAARPSHLIEKVGNIVAWFERYQDSEQTSTNQ